MDYKAINLMLSRVFVEIRATSNIKKAQGLADIFHNAPNQMIQGVREQDILTDLRRRADRHGARKLVESYIQAAQRPERALYWGRLGDLEDRSE